MFHATPVVPAMVVITYAKPVFKKQPMMPILGTTIPIKTNVSPVPQFAKSITTTTKSIAAKNVSGLNTYWDPDVFNAKPPYKPQESTDGWE